MKAKVGLIGLGLMGSPMAKNLLKAGFPLTAYNRTPSRTKELQKLGAEIATSPSDLASKVDILITMVTAPKDVKAVLFGKNGVVEGAKANDKRKENLIVIDMSTVGKTAAIEIGSRLEKNSIDFLDAPVTGGIIGASNAELVIYIGGKESIFEKARPTLSALGKSLNYIGKTGSGQSVKLINNHLIAASITALSEGMLLADEMGISRAKVANAIKDAPIVSKQMNRVMPNYVTKKFPVFFSIANMKKDVTLALKEVTTSKKKNFKILSITQKLYSKAIKSNRQNEDYSSIIKELES